MKRVVWIFVLGVVGLAAALTLTVAALALAGNDVGSVVHPALSDPSRSPAAATNSPGEDRSDGPSATSSASAPGDDRATDGPGEDSSDEGSGGSSGNSDSSGSGSGSSGEDSSGEDHSDDDD